LKSDIIVNGLDQKIQNKEEDKETKGLRLTTTVSVMVIVR